MRVLGIIPARGGSKEIPRKNIAVLNGKPLLAYTASAALGASRLDRVILSTEDEEIAEIGRAFGLEVPFIRPEALARDEVQTIDVLQHAVKTLSQDADEFDVIVTLQPTTPFRGASDIDGAIDLLETTGADSVVSLVHPGGVHPFKMKTLSDDGWVGEPGFARGKGHLPRQVLPSYWLLEGSLYITRRKILMEENRILGERTQAWIVEPQRTVNIDTPFDLWLAERMLAEPPSFEKDG